MLRQRGYWRENGDQISAQEAWDVWAEHAYDILVEVARSYHAIITYGELRDRFQAASGIRTSALLQNWIGKVLNRVIHEARRRGDPPLSALAVRARTGRSAPDTTRSFGSSRNRRWRTRSPGRSMPPRPGWPATATSGPLCRQVAVYPRWRRNCGRP
ncbi:hypothetical protein ACSNN9_06075 [Micromonospora sp. URMC 107]|uniref:hypothetical protein n=1 Tax=Micromonospora sp. URMC 107 TaxID=3423418 RepID=UPI003F1CE308